MKTDERTINETPLTEIIDHPIGGKKNIILDSQIFSTFMSCARLADFRFNNNLISISGKSNSLEVGSVVHKFLEVYRQSIIKGVPKSQAAGFGFAAAELYIQGCPHCTDFNGLGKPTCGHKIDDYPGLKNTPKESEGYLIGWHYALDTCQQYLDHYKNDFWTPLEVETVHGILLYEDDELRILWKAKLDAIFDTNSEIVSVDTKTMKQNRDQLSLNNQFIGQCLVMHNKRMYIDKVGFQKTLKPEDKFKRIPITYNESSLLEWQTEIVPYYAKLLIMYAENGYFPPNFTHCETKYGNCPFSDVCSAPVNLREDELKRSFKVGRVWDPSNEDF